MSVYYSPEGNAEVWEEKPAGYYTVEEWQAMQPAITVTPLTSKELYEMLRIWTEQRLAITDKYALIDFPNSDLREKMLAYRAALRALNHQPGAPWPDGDIPWPVMPEVE